MPLRLVLFGLSAGLALYGGFAAFSVETSRNLIRFGGYYIALGTFAWWVVALVRSWRTGADGARLPHGELAAAATAIAVLTLIAVTHESYRSKILYDEYVLQATAHNLHFFRENSAIVRGYELGGVFLSIESYVDKRPVFFPFLVSLVHDLTGYRPGNAFALNTALFPVVLALVYWLGRQLNGWRGGLLALLLLGSLPLLAQNATGAGMELLNFGMLLVAILLASEWLRQPDETRLNAFILAVVLLVQSRYESAAFVGPAALTVAWGWWRCRRIVLSAGAIFAPLLLVPVALQQKVVAASPVMWELRANQTSRFSLEYLSGNLQAAWGFLTAHGLGLANSLLVTWLGLASLAVLGVRLGAGWRRWRTLSPAAAAMLFFGAGCLGITALMMFYYWAQFNDPMASRFALPLCLVLVLATVATAAWADRRSPASLVGLVAAGIFVLAGSAPKQSYHFYSHMGNDELAWEQRMVRARPPGPRLILTNKSTLPWMITSTPAILLERARAVADRLAEQLSGPDFQEILVTQGLRPTSVEGDYQLTPEDVLPDWFCLELVAERRFGTKLARISRLVAIDLPTDFHPSSPPPVTSGEARTAESPEK